MSRRPGLERRTRPDRPYRKVPVRRLLLECNRRLRDARGPRAFELIAALVYRWPQVQSGIVYLGDSCLDAGRPAHCCSSCRKQGRESCEHPHCCAARLMGERCGKTAHRAKFDLHRVGLVRLHGAGPRHCSCSRCGGDPAGGRIQATRGEMVSAATGYELDADMLGAGGPRASSGVAAAQTAERPEGARARYLSPAEARLREEGQAKLQRALEKMRQRAGP